MTVTYLDAKRIVGSRRTATPRNPYASGFGRKIPTSHLVTLDDKRERRVYMIQIANAGSAYVVLGGSRHFLDTDCEERIEALQVSA